MSLTETTPSDLLARRTRATDRHDDPAAERIAVGPWPAIRGQARAIAVAAATCLVILTAIELAFFRSGFFAMHVAISNPQAPLAKLALAERHPEAQVVYVGDSTIMTSVVPTVVSAECASCGPGFNAGFAAANPWLTRAMTRRLLGPLRPHVVVISVSPWTVDSAAQFTDSDLARQLMSPAELEALGASLALDERIDATLAGVWSAYGQRLLIKEWFSAFAPGQRYDESLLGYWVAPGSANSSSRVAALAGRLFANVGDAEASAPGAQVIASLVDELHARGIKAVFLIPPLHPASYEIAGPYLRAAEAAIADVAAQHQVPMIDCRSAVDAADFRDATHILPTAAERHSRCVGQQLRALALD
jgi:hypothetical protein